MFKKLFLPVGMVLAIVISFLYPPIGIWMKKVIGSNPFIVIIFLVCGWRTKFGEMNFDRKFLVNFIVCGVISLIVAPLIGLGLGHALRLDQMAILGLIIISCVPATLSSGIVMAETAGGNVLLAMMMTVIYNLVGVVSMPLVISWCVPGNADVDTNPLKMFCDLLLLVLLPFFIGWAVQKFAKLKPPAWTGYLPSACVILLILGFFSGARDKFLSYDLKLLAIAIGAGVLLRVIFLAIFYWGGLLLKMKRDDRVAAMFTAGSKSLTIALTMLAIIGAGNSTAIIPCMVFYALQAMIDSVLAAKLKTAE